MQVRTAKDLGAAIKQARIQRGLTQSTLAMRLDVQQSRISEIEQGAPGVAVGTILRILAAIDAVIIVRQEGTSPKARPHISKKHRDSVDLDAIANTGLEKWPTKR